MNFKKNLVLSVAVWLGASAFADQGALLLNFDYRLRANENYATGLYGVYNAPVSTRRIVIKQVGDYCNITINRVEYNARKNDYLQDAVFTGTAGVYELATGVVNAVDVHFTQTYWDNVDCSLKIYAEGAAGPGVDEALLGAIRYSGGFMRKASLRLGQTYTLREFRLDIPSFCKGVSVLEGGTVSGGIFYPSKAYGSGSFTVDGVGAATSEIQVSLNGPFGASCDIPVYGK